MKVLESTPERYDLGMKLLSRGRLNGVYESIADSAGGEGRKILDIGCGTGNLSLACASRGSTVVGIDINAGMLEVARRKCNKAGLDRNAEFLELGVGEIRNRFADETFDACVSCLAFSEMTEDEKSYAITSASSILKAGGLFMIADETEPVSTGRRILRKVSRIPVRIMAYALSQSTTRPMEDPSTRLMKAGFTGIEKSRLWRDTFMVIKAYRGPLP